MGVNPKLDLAWPVQLNLWFSESNVLHRSEAGRGKDAQGWETSQRSRHRYRHRAAVDDGSGKRRRHHCGVRGKTLHIFVPCFKSMLSF